MIIKSGGFKIGHFRIPPFELNEGELISICLFGGRHFFELEMELVKLLTGFHTKPNLDIYQKIEFVEHIEKSDLRNSIFPISVGKYLDKNGNATLDELKKTLG